MRLFRSRRKARDEQGAVVVFVAVCMLLFIGMLAFTVDMGMLRSERARAQGAADNVALKAVYAYCQSKKTKTELQAHADGVAAGQAVATSNGYTATVTQQLTDWKAEITTSTGTKFSSVIGTSSLSTKVSAVAAANCAPNVAAPAFHADGQSCGDKSFEWSGSNALVTGAVHSNDEIKFGGNNNVFGQGTYVDTVKDSNKIVWTPPLNNPSKSGVKGYPVTYDYNSFLPTSAGGPRSLTEPGYFYKTGNWEHSSGILPSGTYVVNGDIKLSGGTINGLYTFVAKGKIELSASNTTMVAREQGLLMFANGSSSCDSNERLSINGSNHKLTGIISAPNGWAKVEGSNHIMTASILARSLYVGGSNFTLVNFSTPAGKTSGITLVR